jgi:hypothetical protein
MTKIILALNKRVEDETFNFVYEEIISKECEKKEETKGRFNFLSAYLFAILDKKSSDETISEEKLLEKLTAEDKDLTFIPINNSDADYSSKSH